MPQSAFGTGGFAPQVTQQQQPQQQPQQGGGNGQYGSTNRYIPPTFNWGSNAAGQPTDYSQMNWNTMQDYYMPQQTNNPYGNQYMSSLQQMLGQFGGQYGGPNRRPMMPNFGSYNPGFGGPTSFYDQQQGGGGMNPEAQMGWAQFRGGSGGGRQGPVDPGWNMDNQGYGGGQGQTQELRLPGVSMEQYLAGMDNNNGQGGRGQWGNNNQGGMGQGYGGGFGGGQGWGQMPQFNPYMLMQNRLQGMSRQDMFPSWLSDYYGGSGMGRMTPNSQQGGNGVSVSGETKPLNLGGGG